MGLAGYTSVGVSSTFRCSAYQDHLFAQGRTRPGSIVTNARGGQSIHNHRLAFDIFQNIRGREWNEPAFFATSGRIWREMGGTWGGDWASFVDRTHCEFTGGLTLADLQRGRQLPDDARMPWETSPGAISLPEPAPPESFPISEDNLARMVQLGVMQSPEYWRSVTTVRHLNELLTNAGQEGRLSANIDNGTSDIEAALNILQHAGIVNSPNYWRSLVSSENAVPHLDKLLVDLAKRCLLPTA